LPVEGVEVGKRDHRKRMRSSELEMRSSGVVEMRGQGQVLCCEEEIEIE